MELILHVSARILHREGNKPLESSYTVQLFDDDAVTDDLLGSTHADNNGMVYYQVNPYDFKTPDSFIEKLPDLYLVIKDKEEVIYRSPIAQNTDVLESGNFNTEEGATIHLGTFLVAV